MNDIKKAALYKTMTAFGVLLCATNMLSGQNISEYDRMRMEILTLRQMNDSLQKELANYKRAELPDLWAGLSHMDEDADVDMDYTGFGLRGEKRPSALQREVALTIPSFRLNYNDIYEKYIENYTVTRHKSMPYILGRYNMYLPMFRETFAKYGVPQELTALCIVESAVSREALSPAGALGMWQLMPETARQYGLVVDETLDERLVVDKATDVAARVLRDLKRSLGTWELAVLAYNCGSGNVRKAIIRSGGSKDIWEIYDWLPTETRAYLPSLVAAAYCVKYHANYDITPRNYTRPSYESYTLKKACLIEDLAVTMAMNAKELRKINCEYVQGLLKQGMAVSVPPGMGRILEVNGF